MGAPCTRPEIDEAAGVLGVDAVGVVETQRAAGAAQGHARLVDRRRQRAELELSNRGPPSLSGALDAPMADQPLDHEGRGGQEKRRFAGPPADKAGQRENRGEQQDKHKGRERREMARKKAAAQRDAQAEARRGGLRFRRRQGEGVRPERIRRRRPSWLSRRLGVDGERMQAVGEFGRQQAVDEPMPRDPAEAREPPGDDSHAIVRAAARTRAGMPGVPVGFVDDVETLRLKPFRQTRDNSFLHGHRPLSRSASSNTK